MLISSLAYQDSFAQALLSLPKLSSAFERAISRRRKSLHGE